MSSQPSEAGSCEAKTNKVAVVVIHGVGETYEGWIDENLVPRLEAWLAYRGLESQYNQEDPDYINGQLDKPSLMIPVLCGGDQGTADRRWITVSLGGDQEFAAFCRCVDRLDLAGKKEFESLKARLSHRDDLVNELWEIVKLRKTEEFLSALKAAGVPTGYAFNPDSEVNRVRDPDNTKDPAATWKSFTRYWRLPEREVVLTEMFWADLSYGGGIILTRILSMIELFLEAPYVLGRAFLGSGGGVLEKFIRKLVLAANWVMRWPIAGLNAAIFAACFAAIVLSQFDRLDMLPAAVTGTLLGVALIGRKAALVWRHDKPGLSDLGLAAFMFALMLAAWVAASCIVTGEYVAAPAKDAVVTYLNISVRVLLGFWFLWSALNVVAVVVVSLVAVARYLWWLPKRIVDKARAADWWRSNIQPLARPAAAIGSGVLMGIVWKLVLAALGLLVIALLGGMEGKTLANCSPPDLSIVEVVFNLGGYNSDNSCQLVFANQHLNNVLTLNFIAAVGVVLALLFVMGWRRAAAELDQLAAEGGTLVMPRLIAHPVLISMLFAVSAAGFWVFYFWPYLAGTAKPENFIGAGLGGTLPPAIGLVIFASLLSLAAEYSSNVVHIGRDLVDHQYYRNEKTIPARLHAKLAKKADADTEVKARVPLQSNGPDYLRRMRIQRRLEALIEDVVQYQDANRLIFFAHSQGTVILHDYLLNVNGAMLANLKGRQRLNGMQVDVLTFGSPLGHIYRYYYDEYSRPVAAEAADLENMVRVDSWTNMWRVDDPIGRHLHDMPNIKNAGKLYNKGIGLGGHTDYWRSPEVCAALWALIEGRSPACTPQPGSMADALRVNQMPPLFDRKQG